MCKHQPGNNSCCCTVAWKQNSYLPSQFSFLRAGPVLYGWTKSDGAGRESRLPSSSWYLQIPTCSVSFLRPFIDCPMPSVGPRTPAYFRFLCSDRMVSEAQGTWSFVVIDASINRCFWTTSRSPVITYMHRICKKKDCGRTHRKMVSFFLHVFIQVYINQKVRCWWGNRYWVNWEDRKGRQRLSDQRHQIAQKKRKGSPGIEKNIKVAMGNWAETQLLLLIIAHFPGHLFHSQTQLTAGLPRTLFRGCEHGLKAENYPKGPERWGEAAANLAAGSFPGRESGGPCWQKPCGQILQSSILLLKSLTSIDPWWVEF